MPKKTITFYTFTPSIFLIFGDLILVLVFAPYIAIPVITILILFDTLLLSLICKLMVKFFIKDVKSFKWIFLYCLAIVIFGQFFNFIFPDFIPNLFVAIAMLFLFLSMLLVPTKKLKYWALTTILVSFYLVNWWQVLPLQEMITNINQTYISVHEKLNTGKEKKAKVVLDDKYIVHFSYPATFIIKTDTMLGIGLIEGPSIYGGYEIVQIDSLNYLKIDQFDRSLPLGEALKNELEKEYPRTGLWLAQGEVLPPFKYEEVDIQGKKYIKFYDVALSHNNARTLYIPVDYPKIFIEFPDTFDGYKISEEEKNLILSTVEVEDI